MGATLDRSVAIGQRAIAISAGPPLRRGALRGAHGKPGRARALAWNRVCGAIGSEFSDARAVELKCADRGTKFYSGEISQATRAYMHEIECVERLGLNSLMRALLS